MKSGMLLLVLAVGVGAIGYQEIRHQAEREEWRAAAARLEGLVEQTERQAAERIQALRDAENDDHDTGEARAELAELEARILDASAELARLESDRAVAETRATSALEDLKQQVRSLTEIEMDMAVLDRQRRRLEGQLGTVEQRLRTAEIGAAERQKRAEALDRDIAGLAMRRESLQASLEAVERTMAKTARAQLVDQATAAATPPQGRSQGGAADPPALDAGPEAISPGARETIVEPADVEDQDRTRGLYQFSSLSAAPEAASSGQGGRPPSRNRSDDIDGIKSGDWAEDQYLMGLTLLSTAERSSGTRELSDAVLAFKAVLGEWPKQRDAMRWAIARSDFGYALALLGKRQGDAALLEQAAAACRDALRLFDRDETPLLWAAAQHHLGVSLSGLADLRADRNLRQASIEALERAIATFKRAGAEADAGKAESRLREASSKLRAISTEPAD